jgi:rod shape-determining protein MreD
MGEYVKYSIILLVLVIVQKTLIWLIAVTNYEITPDIVLIGIVYVGIRKGKLVSSIGGFIFGLIIDMFSFSFLGLSALSKCAGGFVSGYFNSENKIERYTHTYVFIFIILLCSFINNIIYFEIYFQGTNLSFIEILIRYIIPTSVYTALVGIIPIVFSRKKVSFR